MIYDSLKVCCIIGGDWVITAFARHAMSKLSSLLGRIFVSKKKQIE